MITEEMISRYHLPRLTDSNATEFYATFLAQTDYIPNKIVEAQFRGVELNEDYTEIIYAREYARQMIDSLSEE